MSILENCEDGWKEQLRSNLIIGMTGSKQEIASANMQIDYCYQCFAPVSLYKYYGCKERHLDMVRSNKMWYAAPCSFNDVFDCDISVHEDKVFQSVMQTYPDPRGIRKGSKKWVELSGLVHRELRKLQQVFDGYKTNMGIACFSESDDSLLMWAHYADNHRGMCVEYELPKIASLLKFSPVPIIYATERVSFDSLTLENPRYDATNVFIKSITTKSPEWAYEKEWRIIRDNVACGDKWDEEKKGALLDTVSPRSISLGCAVEHDFEDAVKEYCTTYKISLYKMEKDPYLYRLNKKALITFDS